MNKQPQTFYVVNNGKTDLILKGIRKFEYVNELTDRYIFTKEELETHDIEISRNDGLDELIEWLEEKHKVYAVPAFGEVLIKANELKSQQNRKQ